MSELTSIVRHVGRRKPVEPENSNPYAGHPDWWVGTLATSIYGHLNGKQPRSRLEHDFQEFLASPCCDRELRKILEPTKGKQ